MLVGGGVGVPPMFGLAKRLRAMGKEVQVILGFNTKEEIFYEEAFQALGLHRVRDHGGRLLRHPRLCDRCFEKSQLQPLLRLRPRSPC